MFIEFLLVDLPIIILVKSIRNTLTLILRDAGCIEWVARSRNHDGIIWLADDASDDQMQALRNPLGEDDRTDGRLMYTVYSGNVFAYTFPDEGETCRLAVAARTDYCVQDESGSLPGIGIDGFVGDQVGIQHA